MGVTSALWSSVCDDPEMPGAAGEQVLFGRIVAAVFAFQLLTSGFTRLIQNPNRTVDSLWLC
jgi:hypothetical protein